VTCDVIEKEREKKKREKCLSILVDHVCHVDVMEERLTDTIILCHFSFCLNMVEAADIVAMLTERVSKKDGYQPKGNKQIHEFIQYLFETIQTFLSTLSFEIYDESTLDQTHSSDDSSEDEFQEGDSQESEDIEETESEEMESNDEQTGSTTEIGGKKDEQSTDKFSLQYMKQVLDYYDEINQNGKRKHSWKSVSRRFRRIPHRQYIFRFRDYVRRNGSKRQKLDEIDAHVFTLFREARDQSLCIHDADLQRWAVTKAQQQSMFEFVASNHWVQNFKYKHRIVSRKISKVISSQSVKSADEIEASAEEFVNIVQAEMKNYSPSQVFNTDQVGLTKEFRSSRTLTFKGEKTTTGSVRSKNANSHSYTIQPLVNMDGKVVGRILLCLQEPNGRLSEGEVKFAIF
jgi:hypothetical protein